MTPQFEHDCEYCHFAGQVPFKNGMADMYVCGSKHPNYVFRYSDYAPDYYSFTDYTVVNESTNIQAVTDAFDSPFIENVIGV